jgi:hypothetical protein
VWWKSMTNVSKCVEGNCEVFCWKIKTRSLIQRRDKREWFFYRLSQN